LIKLDRNAQRELAGAHTEFVQRFFHRIADDDFRLYNNAFILRQRIAYESGFPAGKPEIVFKFRYEDMQKAAALDVRPKFAGNYRIKFKAEAPPLRDQVGGYRLLFSHNAQFPLSQAPETDRESMGTLARVFPALEALKTSTPIGSNW
jgi:hypothetical protein